MIDLAASLKAVGGARTGIAPANLLDVLDVNGNLHFWSDRLVSAPNVLTGFLSPSGVGALVPPVAVASNQAVAWAFPQSLAGSTGLYGGYTGPGASGYVAQEYQGPFTGKNEIVFSDFEPSTLPAGAVVDATYLVVNHSEGQASLSSSIGGIGPTTEPGVYSGPPGSSLPSLTVAFSLWNTVPPSAGPNWISIFLGYDIERFVIFSIGVAIYFHIPGASEAGGGSFSDGGPVYGSGPYRPWIISVPEVTFHRSQKTDVGNFVIQNVSGDTLSRDMEKILRASAFEGAQYVYRIWEPAAEAPWLEVHGTLTVVDDGVDTITLKGKPQIDTAADDNQQIYSETCQLQWAGRRCGSTQATECQYSYQTCQVPERIMVTLNDYEKNYGEALADTPFRIINRRRQI